MPQMHLTSDIQRVLDDRDDLLVRKLETEQHRRDERQVHQELVTKDVTDQQKKVDVKLKTLRLSTERQQDSVDRILDGLKVLVNNYEEAEAMQAKVASGRISRLGQEDLTTKKSNTTAVSATSNSKGLAGARKQNEKKQMLDDDDEFDPDFPCLWIDLSTDPESIIGKIVTSFFFDAFFAIVIILNAIFIGYASQYAMDHARWPKESDQRTDFITAGEYVFFGLYALELLCRLLTWRMNFFYNSDWGWNWFDTILVVLAAYDILVAEFENNDEGGGANLTWMRLLRLLKMLKMLRVVRVMRLFRELRLMLYSVIASLRSLLWTCLMLGLMLYIFGLCFLQGVTAYLNSEGPIDVNPEIRNESLKYYGSVSESMLTLYMVITAGLDWDLAAKPLLEAGEIYYYLFMFYIAFLTFVVLNVLTGIFVENALLTAHQDKHDVQKEEINTEMQIMKDLISLFKDVADESDGKVWWQDFQGLLSSDRRLIDFMDALQVEAQEAGELFKTLSDNGRMKVSCADFVKGCLRIKGVAESQDLMGLMYVSHKYMTQLPILMGYVDDCFNEMHKIFERQGKAKSGLKPLQDRLTNEKVSNYAERLATIKKFKADKTRGMVEASENE